MDEQSNFWYEDQLKSMLSDIRVGEQVNQVYFDSYKQLQDDWEPLITAWKNYEKMEQVVWSFLCEYLKILPINMTVLVV